MSVTDEEEIVIENFERILDEINYFEEIEEELAEQAFGSSGGKSRVAAFLVSLIPEHKTFVEPFAGGAAVFWKKEQSVREVLNDADTEIAFAYQFIRDVTEEQVTKLKQQYWEPSKELFFKLRDSKAPSDPVERFYRFMYVLYHSYGRSMKTFGYQKRPPMICNRLMKHKERLKGVIVRSGDYKEVMKEFDSPETFYFLDPPYPGEWAGPQGIHHWKEADVKGFSEFLNTLKGKFLITLNDLPWVRESLKQFRQTTFIVPRTFRKGDEPKEELLVSNYDLPKKQELSQIPDFISNFTDAILIKDAVSVVGSSVEKEEHKDIDILCRLSDPSDFLKRAIQVRITKMFPDEQADKLHFIWGDPEGPHDTYIPIFDLCLISKKPKIMEMMASGMMSPVATMKPAHRFYDPREAVEYSFSKAEIWACEKKYNGFRAMIHKQGNEVRIYSDQQKNITFPFPTAEAQAKSASLKDFIIDCEMVPYQDNKPLGRDVAARYIGTVKSHKDVDDSQVIFFAFDCLYLDGDLKDKPWSERKRALNSLKFSANIKNTASVVVDTKDEMFKAIRMFANMAGSEGSVIKNYESPYTPGKESDLWIKYRTLLPVKATVIKVNQVKGDTSARNYEIGIRVSKVDSKGINPKYLSEDGKFMVMGNTFNTSIPASEGDVLELLVEEVWRHKHKDGTIHYSFHKPNVKGISETSRNSTLGELDAYVVARGVEIQMDATTSADVAGSPVAGKALEPTKIVKVDEDLQKEGNEPEDRQGQSPNNFPPEMQGDFRKVMESGNLNEYVQQWHYRGHEITDAERSKDSIPEKYKYRMRSLHLDNRFKIDGHLDGMTMLAPTSVDTSDPDQVGKETKNVRAVLKAPQPVGWLKVQGIAPSGEPGTTRNAPAVFVIVGKGKYKPVIVEDHRIIMEMHPDSGQVSKAVFEQADKDGILIERKPDSNFKSMPKYLNFHIAHIGDHHIILVDGENDFRK
jgi:ATP-dependent DNA ligase/site-specific DNA-adenine methylase